MTEPHKPSRAEQLLNRYRDEVKREKERNRKLDDGRKIVLGGCLIAAMRDDPALRDQVGKLVDKYVTKPGDRTRVEQWLPQRQA
jgi:hypothetical protein